MRKVRSKSIRVGQTLWYPQYVPHWEGRSYTIRMVRVLSDRSPVPELGVIEDGFPRRYILDRMSIGGGPIYVAYSRRRVLSWINKQGGKLV